MGALNIVNQTTLGQINYAGAKFNTLADVISPLLEIIYKLSAIIVVLMIIWAGIQWMTAGTNDNQVANAKKTLMSAVIGFIIVLAAFVIDSLIKRSFGVS